jgi:four helix bundle protein
VRRGAGEGCQDVLACYEAFGVADFRKLRVWQAAQAMAIDAHRVAGGMRGATTRALCDQLVRAAMSVPANIVEGSAHSSPRECARYLQYALASVSELEGHVLLARDLEFMNDKEFGGLLSRVVNVRRMLHGLLKTVKARCGA